MEQKELLLAAVKILMPPPNISSMKKKDILAWVEANKILERYRIFYDQGSEVGLKSSVTEISDTSNPVPSSTEFAHQRVGLIRKQITKWTRDLKLRKMRSRRVNPQALKAWLDSSKISQMMELGGVPDSPTKAPQKSQPASGPGVQSMLQHLEGFMSSKEGPTASKGHKCEACSAEDPDMASDMAEGPIDWESDQPDPAQALIFKTCPNLWTRVCETALSLDLEILECRLKEAKACKCAEGGSGIRVSHRGLKVPADLKPQADTPDIIYMGGSGPGFKREFKGERSGPFRGSGPVGPERGGGYAPEREGDMLQKGLTKRGEIGMTGVMKPQPMSSWTNKTEN